MPMTETETGGIEPIEPTVTSLRGWPGRRLKSSGRTATEAPPWAVSRLGQRLALHLVAAADRDHPERLGLLAWRLAYGPTALAEGLVHDDALDANGRRRLASWAKRQGASSFELSPLSAWNREVLQDRGGYKGKATVVGPGLGRTLALAAAWWNPTQGSAQGGWFGRDGWTLGLTGCGHVVDHKRWVPAPHRPQLRVIHLGARGLTAEWMAVSSFHGGPAGQWDKVGNGKMVPRKGRFVELLAAAHALDGDDTDDFASHLEAFELERCTLPVAVSVDSHGAGAMVEALNASHALASALDAEAASLLGGLDLAKLTSPGALASTALARMGVTPPLAAFPDISDESLVAWMGAHHGGWVEARPEWCNAAFPVADLDVSSAYPAVASLVGWWDHLNARKLVEVDATADVRELLHGSAGDCLCDRLMKPETWRAMGFTLVTLAPEQVVEVPITLHEVGQDHTHVGPVRCDVPMHYSWADVALSALRTGQAPKILSAVRLVAVGRQEGLRSVPLVRGATKAVLDPHGDPSATLVDYRQAAKDRLKAGMGRPSDARRAVTLRVAVNALVYGQAIRCDPTWAKRVVPCATGSGHTYSKLSRSERPAIWTWPPIASTMTAGPRLLLAMVAHRVEALGGTVAYLDTDGAMVVASPDGGGMPALPGGPVTTADGRSVKALSWAEVDAVLEPFKGLVTWKVERQSDDGGKPLWAIVWGVKRYALFTRHDDGDLDQLTERTEHSLGGVYVDPPPAAGRDAAGRHTWTASTGAALIHQALAGDGADRPGGHFSWERAGGNVRPPAAPSKRFPDWKPEPLPPELFPAILRRYQSTSRNPEEPHGSARSTALALRPFSYFLQVEAHQLTGPKPKGALRAADPGGDLSNWAQLTWVDGKGQPYGVCTDPEAIGGLTLGRVRLVTLAERAEQHNRTSGRPPAGTVRVLSALTRRVGRSGAAMNLAAANPQGDASYLIPVYGGGLDLAKVVADAADKIGPKRFSELTGIPLRTAAGISAGSRPRAATVAKVLAATRKLPEVPEALAALLVAAPDPTLPRPAYEKWPACDGCGTFLTGRQRQWCSDVCQKRAERLRKKPLAMEVAQ